MKISKDKDPGRKLPWRLDGYFGGRRIRLFFRTEREASAELKRLTGERRETGAPADRLSPKERIVLAELRDEVVAAGGTMEEAVAFWLAHAAPPSSPLRMDELLERVIEAKDGEGKSARYLAQLRSSVGQFCRWEGTGGLWAHEITADRVRDWAEGNGWAGKTRRNYLIDVRTVFEFGKNVAGAVRSNPTDGIPLPPDAGEEEVPVLSPHGAARLIVRCLPGRKGRFEGDEHVLMLGYVVIGTFAGLRPERELGNLRLDRIDLEEATVVVDAGLAKSRSRRVVDLSPNAVALLRIALPPLREYWRKLAKDDEGRLKDADMPLCPRNFRRRWEKLRKACGFALEGTEGPRPWRHDVMRHSFASYHYAKHQNETLLKAQMGHTKDSDTLFSNYRRRVSRRKAERFWGIGSAVAGNLGRDEKQEA